MEKPDPYEINLDQPIQLKDIPSWRYMAQNWSSNPVVGRLLNYLLDQIEPLLKEAERNGSNESD